MGKYKIITTPLSLFQKFLKNETGPCKIQNFKVSSIISHFTVGCVDRIMYPYCSESFNWVEIA